MSRFFRYLCFVLLIPLLLEGLLQVGALVVKGQARAMPTGWLTDRVRVLAIGDSNTYGLYLQERDSYPRQLETQWNADATLPPIEVINLGYPGTNSFRLRENLGRILDTFEPDIVLLMIGFNDFWTPVETVAEEQRGMLDWVRAHSRLYHLAVMWQRSRFDPAVVRSGADLHGRITDDEVRQLMQATGLPESRVRELVEVDDGSEESRRVRAALESVAEQRKAALPGSEHVYRYGEEDFFLGVKEGVPARNMKSLQANLLAMRDMVQQHRARLVLLTYPSEAGFYPPANRWIRKTAAEAQLPLIDITPVLTSRCTPGQPCPDYFFHDFHASAKGNALIAAHVKAALAADQVMTDLR